MADAVAELDAATAARKALIRRYTLRYIGLRGRAYSRELSNRLRERQHIDDVTVQQVQCELKAMEAEGPLVSQLERGPTMLRRYYRIKAEVANG